MRSSLKCVSNSARVRTKNTGNSHIWQSKVCSNNNNSICDTEEWSRRGSGFGAAEHAQPAAWPLQRVSAARHRKLPRNSKIPGFVTSRLLWFDLGGRGGVVRGHGPPKLWGANSAGTPHAPAHQPRAPPQNDKHGVAQSYSQTSNQTLKSTMLPMPKVFPRIEVPTFESGKPVCPSGRAPTQGTTRVQNPDGTWKTVAVGAWRCGTPTFIGH